MFAKMNYWQQKVKQALTNAVSSCGLEISVATVVDGFVCLADGVGALSLSFSPNLDGVGTFKGKAKEGIDSADISYRWSALFNVNVIATKT